MKSPRLAKILVPILLIIVGIVGLRLLVSQKKSTEKKAPEAVRTVVGFVEAQAGTPNAKIRGTGTVEGEQQVALSTLVSGEVTYVSNELLPGGRFRKGKTLLKIDTSDYEVAVAQERARVQQAELEFAIEQKRAETAQREWELLGEGQDAVAAPLALRQPHLATAEQVLEAARAGHKRAKLNLARTRLKAPFNALVISESADLGQVLAPGAAVATLVGTDSFLVRVAVPVEQLLHIAIPGVNGKKGSSARVIQDLGDNQQIIRTAKVHKLGGQIDPQSRTASLFLRIEDPFSVEGLPLLPQAFVRVEIEGLPMEGALAVPRVALSEGNFVWTVSPEETLQRNEVTIGWRDGETAFVTSGLSDGARVIVTPLSLPIEGAQVQPSLVEGS
jgi:RND family efflux transporter MFP subunit